MPVNITSRPTCPLPTRALSTQLGCRVCHASLGNGTQARFQSAEGPSHHPERRRKSTLHFCEKRPTARPVFGSVRSAPPVSTCNIIPDFARLRAYRHIPTRPVHASACPILRALRLPNPRVGDELEGYGPLNGWEREGIDRGGPPVVPRRLARREEALVCVILNGAVQWSIFANDPPKRQRGRGSSGGVPPCGYISNPNLLPTITRDWLRVDTTGGGQNVECCGSSRCIGLCFQSPAGERSGRVG